MNTTTALKAGKGVATKFQRLVLQKNNAAIPQQIGYRSTRGAVSRFLSSTAVHNSDDEDQVVVFKPWKFPVMEADGDYRSQVHLEEHIGGPLYENQKALPKLPIPTLKETIDRFLPTALPLAKSKEEELDLIAACENFEEQAQALQARLVERKDVDMSDTSWLQSWWNTVSVVVYAFSSLSGVEILPQKYCSWEVSWTKYLPLSSFSFWRQPSLVIYKFEIQ